MSGELAAGSIDDARRLLGGLALADPSAAPPLALTGPHRAGARAATDAGAADRTPGAYNLGSVRRSPLPRSLVPDGAGTLADAVVGLRKGSVSCRALVEQALDAVARTAELGAVVHLNEHVVRAEADALDAEARDGRFRGPLHGIPVTVKDVIHVTGMPTRAGSLVYEDLDPAEGAAVARLRAAGALVLAKAATHEFALGVTTPQCRNPHNPSVIAGGSSGGSAIAVATGVGLASLGTDTRASLRVPSALCGVVGFKPTLGRVPIDGIVPLSWTMDHVGPIASTVADAAIVMDVLQGAPYVDAAPDRAGGPPVIGVVTGALEAADPAVAAAVEATLSVLSRAGCPVVAAPGPSENDLDEANAIGLLISRAEAATFHRARRTDLAGCIPEVREQLAAAMGIPAVDYLDAQRHREQLARRTVAAMDGIDVLVLPTTPVVAPPLDAYEDYLLVLSRNAIIWSLVGAPALTLPCGTSPSGLPIGVQLVAAPGRDAQLARTGMLVEVALGER